MALNREILRIALPSILSNITVPLLGLADVALTGHLGAVAYLGAIAVGGMLFNVIYWMFSFLRMGTSGHTAQAFGRNDPRDIMTGLGRSVTAALGISALLLLFRHPVGWLALHLIRPSEAVASLALLYYDICIWGAPAALLLFAVTGWYIGMQNARIPMWVAIVQNVVNISLSVFFVFVLGMKLEGVALGTVLAQYVGLAVALAFWWARYRHLRGELVWRDISDIGGMLRFFRTNKDLFLRTLCLIAIHFFFISAGAGFGDTALAVNTMLMQFFMLYSYIMDGFAFAGEAIVGRAVGACDKVLYRSTVRRLFIWGACMVCLFTAAYALAGPRFLFFLSDDAGVVSAAMAYQPWTLLIPLCSVATFVWDGVFIGELNTRGMLLAMASGLVAFFALYAWWAPLYGNHGLWAAFLSYLAVRGLTQTVYKFL
jgi:MATE family multidrug resistance protein